MLSRATTSITVALCFIVPVVVHGRINGPDASKTEEHRELHRMQHDMHHDHDHHHHLNEGEREHMGMGMGKWHHGQNISSKHRHDHDHAGMMGGLNQMYHGQGQYHHHRPTGTGMGMGKGMQHHQYQHEEMKEDEFWNDNDHESWDWGTGVPVIDYTGAVPVVTSTSSHCCCEEAWDGVTCERWINNALQLTLKEEHCAETCCLDLLDAVETDEDMDEEDDPVESSSWDEDAEETQFQYWSSKDEEGQDGQYQYESALGLSGNMEDPALESLDQNVRVEEEEEGDV
jgi:hypothetical protein